MPKSEPPDTVKLSILTFLKYDKPSNIDMIQAMLKGKFPETYKKKSNLTMIHRHLQALMKEGAVDCENYEGESWYFRTPKAAKYVVGRMKEHIFRIDKEINSIDRIEIIYRYLAEKRGIDWKNYHRESLYFRTPKVGKYGVSRVKVHLLRDEEIILVYGIERACRSLAEKGANIWERHNQNSP